MQPDIQHAARRYKSGAEWGKGKAEHAQTQIVLSFFFSICTLLALWTALIEKKNLIEALEETQATLKTEREAVEFHPCADFLSATLSPEGGATSSTRTE